jgi:hypothetical protein
MKLPGFNYVMPVRSQTDSFVCDYMWPVRRPDRQISKIAQKRQIVDSVLSVQAGVRNAEYQPALTSVSCLIIAFSSPFVDCRADRQYPQTLLD